MKNLRKGIYVFLLLSLLVFLVGSNKLYAEQSDDTPESGITSRIMEIYSNLVSLGYGSSEPGSWGNMGEVWNRIRSAGEWVPDGTVTPADVAADKTFFDDSRTEQVGTALVVDYTLQALQDYTDYKCVNNNGESNTACAADDSESIGEEQVWTHTASGGTPVSVTDNGITVAIASNSVWQDSLTKLYWSDNAASTLDIEMRFVFGDDPVNPTGTSCNIHSAGNANQYCDNQDPQDYYVEDNDVSGLEFCLNLQLDSDNVDGDDNGLTGVETDWRLPNVLEMCQASIDGAANYLPNSGTNVTYFLLNYDGNISSDYLGSIGGFFRGCMGGNNYRNAAQYIRCIRGN